MRFPSKVDKPAKRREVLITERTTLKIVVPGAEIENRALEHTRDFEPMHTVVVRHLQPEDGRERWGMTVETETKDDTTVSVAKIVKERPYSEFSARRKLPLVVAALTASR